MSRIVRTSGARVYGRAVVWTLLAALLVSGCASTSGQLSASSGPSGTAAPAPTGVCVVAGCAASNVTVFVEPDAGVTPVLQAIRSASQSVWVEVYLMTDYDIIHALEDAAHRGVDVRVLLEMHPYGGGSVSAAQTQAELSAAGAQVEASDPAFRYTHEKAMIIDGSTAFIMTCNLSKSGLGGSSYTANREYGVIDNDPADVGLVKSVFVADWNRTTPQLSDSRMIVSPVNARSGIGALLSSAHNTVFIEDEEMYDQQSENLMIADAHRGVQVEVLLPSSTAGNSPDVAWLKAGGVHVRFIKRPYMHAKLIIVDGAVAFVGSENFSSTSLDKNRELGIILSGSRALGVLSTTFSLDWSTGTAA